MKKKSIIISLSAVALALGAVGAFAVGTGISNENAIMTKAVESECACFDFSGDTPSDLYVSPSDYTVDASSSKRGASFGKEAYYITTSDAYEQVSKIEIIASADGDDASIEAYVGDVSFGNASLHNGILETYTITGSSYLDGEVTISGSDNSGTNVWISSITVYIETSTVERITIDSEPNKNLYVEGDKLDLTGMVVTAHYDDGTSKVVTDYTTTPEEGAALTVNDYEVTVVYRYCSTFFEVNILSASEFRYNRDNWVESFLDLTSSACSNPDANNLDALSDDSVWPTLRGNFAGLPEQVANALKTYVVGSSEGDLDNAIKRYDHIINRYLSLRDFLQRRTATSSAKGMFSSASDNGNLNLAIALSCACLGAGFSVFFAIRNKKKES